MSNFAKIRSQCRGKGYADGGRAKSGKTTVNVVVPPSGAGAPGAQAAPPVATGRPGGKPPPPVPPVAANAALGAMGGQPMMKRGGKVKQPAGAGGGMGRLQKSRNKG